MGYHKPFEEFRFRDWRNQVATGGAPVGFQPQTTSIEFNGIDEAMRNQTEQSIGIGTVWSILINFRRRSDTQGLTQVNTMLQLFGSATQNRIFIDANGAEANDPIVVETFGTNGSLNKRFLWNDTIFPFDVWLQMILVWNNSGTALTMYRNGILVARSGQTAQNNFTMNSTNRRVQIGQNGGVQPYSGFIHSIALYNADVASAAVELYNGGTVSSLDLNAASFNANLSHWWRLGQDPSDLGKDSGIAATLIDVDVDSLNIDASDISSESPA